MIAQFVEVTDHQVIVHLVDGSAVAAPVSLYPRLQHGSEWERNHWEMIGRGQGIHWTLLDEDLRVEHIAQQIPSQESPESLQRWLATR